MYHGLWQTPSKCRLISTLSGSLSFSEALGPPVEAGGGANALWLTLEKRAVGQLRVLELLERGEMAVEEWGVGKWPQMLSGLQLRRVGREEEEVDVLWHTQMG